MSINNICKLFLVFCMTMSCSSAKGRAHSFNIELNIWVILSLVMGLQLNVKKVEVIVNWSSPMTILDVQFFLGLANFY